MSLFGTRSGDENVEKIPPALSMVLSNAWLAELVWAEKRLIWSCS